MEYLIAAWAEGPCRRLLRGSGPVLLLIVVLLGPRAAQAQTDTLDEAWRWVRYTTASGLPSNEVRWVLETTTGTVWAVTEQGLAWYDGFRWHGVSAEDGLPEQKEPLKVTPGLQGRLLVVINKHLYRGDEQGFVPLPIEFEGDSLAVDWVVPFEEEALLIVSADRLYRYHHDGVERFPLPAELEQARLFGLMTQTGDSGIWLNSQFGLFRWDGDGWIRRFETYVDFLHEDASGGILAVRAQAAYAGLWTWKTGEAPHLLEQDNTWAMALGVDSRGDAVVAYSDGRVRLRRGGRWQWMDSVPEALVSVNSLHFQQNGDLWVGTNHGLYLHRGSSTRWTRWADVGEQVNEIARTRTGALWLATNEGVSIRHPDGTSQRITAIDGTPLLAVTGLAEDLEGGIWISSGSGFTGAYRWLEGVWQHIGPAQGLRATYIHKILPDRSGRLWFLGQSGIYGGTKDDPEPGAFAYEAGRFTQWGPDQGLLHGRIYAFAEGPDGAQWFGTLKGLSRWKDGQWTHWTTEEGLRATRVFTIAVGSTGRVWFGQQSQGLGYLDEEGRPQYLTVDDGLVDNRVWQLRFGPDDALWIATQDGLSRYQDGAFASFDRAAGLNHPHVWPVLPQEDQVYVGSVGGRLYVLSLEEADNPPLVIDIATPVVDVGDVFLRWQAFAFRGEEAPEHVQTRYRLDEKPWSAWSTEREHVVRNVASGAHTVTVQARSLFGKIEAEGTSVAFRITSPFYRQPPFLTIMAVWLVILLGLGLSYWRKQKHFLAEIEARNIKVEANNIELEAKNAELERFTYTVSHDLKSPLVTIKGFVGLLEKDIAAGHVERVARDVEHINSAADKMQQLLGELLELSRIGRQVNPSEEVSLSEVAREAADLVAGQIAARGVTVEIAPDLPRVFGDRTRLVEVFQNLLDNAVKFMDEEPEPRVEVGARKEGGQVACYVRDNGIGIAPRYHEKIFGLFERLDDHKAGTGIGLALVKRIVEVHGGRVWVESEGEGHGSTFYFTLPGGK